MRPLSVAVPQTAQDTTDHHSRDVRNAADDLHRGVDKPPITTTPRPAHPNSPSNHLGGGSGAIAPATHTPVGMPDGERTGSHSYSPKLTGGESGIQVSEFESVLDQWEKECRQISSVFDSSVVGSRIDLERQRSEEERKAENRQHVETYLDSLITDDPAP